MSEFILVKMAIVYCFLLQILLFFGVGGKQLPRLGIINGRDTDISVYPWQVSIQLSGQHFCGGALISNIWVLTAAHCFAEMDDIRDLKVRAGSRTWKNGGQLVPVARIISHSQYDTDSVENDIALLLLAQPIRVGSAATVDLPDENEDVPEGTLVSVSGWGVTANEKYSDILQEARLPVVSRTLCQKAYSKITDRMFCAGFLAGGVDACQGDSGGSAVVDGYSVGIISYGKGCAEANYPGVYTQTAKYRNWIRQQTGM